jgi:hypothetical protein
LPELINAPGSQADKTARQAYRLVDGYQLDKLRERLRATEPGDHL